MATLIITTGPTDSARARWAQERGKAGGWKLARSFPEAFAYLEDGQNVVLDNEQVAQYDIDIKTFRAERNYKEDNNNGF